MEVDITTFFYTANPKAYSASVMELGQNAGRITWANAMATGEDAPLLTSEAQLDALMDYARGFGAWDDAEIAAWSKMECNALFIQLISADIREACVDWTAEDVWDAYEVEAQNGQASGNLFRADDGRIFYTLGN